MARRAWGQPDLRVMPGSDDPGYDRWKMSQQSQ